jgi:hypothetical protein
MSITPEENDFDNEDLDRRYMSRRHEDAPGVRWEGAGGPGEWMVGVPSWVKAVAVVGIPGVIALFLVYQVASQLPKIEERQAAIEKSLDDEREAVKAQSAKMDQMFRTLQRICSNTAKTGGAQEAAGDAGPQARRARAADGEGGGRWGRQAQSRWREGCRS